MSIDLKASILTELKRSKEIQEEIYRTWNIQDDKYMVAGSLNLSSPFSTDHGVEMHNKVTQLINSGKLVTRNFSSLEPEKKKHNVDLRKNITTTSLANN